MYGALVLTAIVAQNNNWTEGEWVELLSRPLKYNLARQNQTDSRGNEIRPLKARQRLDRAWRKAWAWRSERDDPWTVEEAAENARKLAAAVREFTVEQVGLAANEIAVLRYVAGVVEGRGSDRITIANATFATGAGLGLTAWRTAIRSVIDAGYVQVAEKGVPRSKGRPPRATVYRLVAPTHPEDGVSGAGEPVSDAPTTMPSAVSDAPTSFSADEIIRAFGVDALDHLLGNVAGDLGTAS